MGSTSERQPTYRELRDLVCELRRRIAKQEAHIAELEKQLAAATKNSRNSSKPPSSDIVKPPSDAKRKPGRRKKRRIGGQEGHPKHESELTLDDAERIEEVSAAALLKNPALDLEPARGEKPKILFQYEFAEHPVELTAYVSHPYRNRKTGEIVYAPFPRKVEAAGLLGPQLTAFAACLKGGVHAGYSGTEKVLAFLGVDVCRATICNKIEKVSAALRAAYEELLHALPNEERLNIDETGHKDHPFDKPADHKKHWIWVFVATTFTVFRISNTRSTDVLREVLGPDCKAVIGSDFYSAYTCFMQEANVKGQFCWAHLIRDILFLSESSDRATANYGKRMLKLCKLIFRLQHRREQLGEERFRRRMRHLKETFPATGRRSKAAGAQDPVARLKRYGADYFLFLEDPRIQPTNNLAEQAARHCAIERRITQGTRGHAGRRRCERIRTVPATCARRKRDAFAFVVESVKAFYAGRPQPSLRHAQ